MPTEFELKIAIVDDIEQDRIQIAEHTRDILNHAKVLCSTDLYADGQSLLDEIRSGKRYSLLLLDVLMDDMDGMAVARALREQNNDTMIILISISQELCRRGYHVQAARYLVKPLDHEELKEALLYCCERLAKKEILLPTDKGQHRISFADIQYVEAFERGTRFIMTDETVETKMKFSKVAAMLPRASFLFCHRAYIVNLAQTRRISQYEFLMKSGATVPISRLRYNEINRQFVSFFRD